MSGDHDVGSDRRSERSRSKRCRSAGRSPRKARRAAATGEIIEKLLLAAVDITENGNSRRVTTLEAILLQLSKKALLGDRSAVAAWLKYQKLARQNTKATIKIAFVDGEVTEIPPGGSPTNE
jgi:uncharacterized protein DUF5681